MANFYFYTTVATVDTLTLPCLQVVPTAIDRLCGLGHYMAHFVKTSALNFYSTVHWA